MSDNTASLRHKIDSAVDLQSVVRTMKAHAASSIGQYEKSAQALADYYRAVELGLSVCLRQIPPVPISPVHDAQRNSNADAGVICAVVFGSEQGLVGQFNERVAAHAVNALAALPGRVRRVWAVGERVHARLIDAGVPLAGLFSVPNSVQAIASLVAQMLLETETGRREGEFSEPHFLLFYNRPAPVAGYEPVSQRVLPLSDGWRRTLAECPWPTGNLPEVIGDCTATLRGLIREHLFILLFRACAESLASEHASRLAAMQRAEKSIDELLEQLRGTFRRVRQSSIDEELFDVVAGFEALSSGER